MKHDIEKLLEFRGLVRKSGEIVRVYVRAELLDRVVFLDLKLNADGVTLDDVDLPVRAIKGCMPGATLPDMSQAVGHMLRETESLLSDMLAAEAAPEPARKKLMAPA